MPIAVFAEALCISLSLWCYLVLGSKIDAVFFAVFACFVMLAELLSFVKNFAIIEEDCNCEECSKKNKE